MSDASTQHPETIFDRYRLSDLPRYGKTFVGVFTALMLLVCLWAVWIFYETKGKISQGTQPTYMQVDQVAVDSAAISEEIKQDLAEIVADSEAVHAPVWDSMHAGEEHRLDSAEVSRIALLALAQKQAALDAEKMSSESNFKHNLELAHTHINGQTLLFFAIGLVFLFTSVSPTTKRVIFWLFGVCIVLHVAGLTGQGTHWLWDDLLAVSGVLMLIVIAYMALLIFVDLAKSPRTSKS